MKSQVTLILESGKKLELTLSEYEELKRIIIPDPNEAFIYSPYIPDPNIAPYKSYTIDPAVLEGTSTLVYTDSAGLHIVPYKEE